MKLKSALKVNARKYLPSALVAALRGRGHGIDFMASKDVRKRLKILSRFQKISDNLDCEQSEPEACLVALKLFELSDDIAGDIIECGCYKGGSTTKLSIIAKELGRKLIVFDSFMGLPGNHITTYTNIQNLGQVDFHQGDYAASIEEVRKNVQEYGEPSMVEYIPGFFEDTMPEWGGGIAAIILDVDLVQSTEVCLRYLWPRLSQEGVLLSQDGHLREVCNLLADRFFWSSLGENRMPDFTGLGYEKMIYTYKN